MKKQNLTDEYFLNRGYKKYDRSRIDTVSVVCHFQKRFDDEIGKKYFIDVNKYSNEWMREREKQQDWYEPYSYIYTCQLYEKETHAPINLEFFSDWSIERVESFVERLFQNGELDYYEKWDES